MINNKKCGNCCTNDASTNPYLNTENWKKCNMLQYSPSYDFRLKQLYNYNMYLRYKKGNKYCINVKKKYKSKKVQQKYEELINSVQLEYKTSSFEEYLNMSKTMNIIQSPNKPFLGLSYYN